MHFSLAMGLIMSYINYEQTREHMDMTAKWNTTDELVGRKVIVYTVWDEEEFATVLAVHNLIDSIRVRTDDGEILIGNQWDEIE